MKIAPETVFKFIDYNSVTKPSKQSFKDPNLGQQLPLYSLFAIRRGGRGRVHDPQMLPESTRKGSRTEREWPGHRFLRAVFQQANRDNFGGRRCGK